MKCVAYMRVSTEKQAEEGNGIDSQKRDIEGYCAKNGMVISDWYIDDGYTGSNMNRPELQRLISDCSRKKVKCVIAWKLDRLSRSMVDGIYMIERIFIPNDVDFRCVHDSISYDSPMEQAYTQMMAVFAQLDKNTMMLRMRGGMLERVKQGYWMGGGNTPYCYEYNKESGILVPIPERSEKMREALELFIGGMSDLRIKQSLGFKSEMVVRKNLMSVVNIGMIPYKGNIYQGKHEPIFEKSRWDLANKIRKSRSASKISSYKVETNLLTGMCYCGICGCKMRYQKYYDNVYKIVCCSHDKYLSYLPNFDGGCKSKNQWAKNIEDKVSREVIKISLDLSGRDSKPKKSRLKIMQDQYEKEEIRLKRLYGLYADGNDAIIETIRDAESKLNDMKKGIENEMRKEDRDPGKQFAYENVKKIADVWDNIDKKSKNMILKTIIDKIVIVNENVEICLKNF